MTIHNGRTRGVLGVLGVAALLALTGCTEQDQPSGPAPTVQDQQAAPGDATTAPGPDDADAQTRRAGREAKSLALGDLNAPKTAAEVGAPFDPCAVTWGDFPAAVRPKENKKPALRPIGPDDDFAVRCSFDNSGAITIGADGTGKTSGGGTFLVSVVWGTELNADPAKRKGSKARSWNGKAGLIHPNDDQKAGKGCVGLVRLSHGVAAVSVTNGRFPAVDPCAVVDSVLTAITKRTP